jgi:hypothetical protein
MWDTEGSAAVGTGAVGAGGVGSGAGGSMGTVRTLLSELKP